MADLVIKDCAMDPKSIIWCYYLKSTVFDFKFTVLLLFARYVTHVKIALQLGMQSGGTQTKLCRIIGYET